MIKVYHVPHARSLRVVWLMEELGEAYEIETLKFPPSGEYLRVNPQGTVPAIEDDGIHMIESIAILQYITGRRLPQAMSITVGPMPDPAAYAAHLQFLHYGEAGLTAPLSVIFRTGLIAPEGQKTNVTTEDQRAIFAKRLGLLDARLSDGRQWIMEDKFTIADISVGYALGLAQYMKLGGVFPKTVADYAARLQARPAFQRAITK